MSPFSIRRAIVTGFIIALAIIVFFVLYTFRNMQRAERENQQLNKVLLSLRVVESVFDDLQDIETGQRGYLISGNANFLEPYAKGLTSLTTDTLAVLRLEGDAERKNDLNLFLSFVRAKTAYSVASVRLRENMASSDTVRAFRAEQGRLLMDSVRNLVAKMEEEDRLALTKFTESRRTVAKNTTVLFAALAILFVGFVIAFFVLVRRDIRKRLKAELEQQVITKTYEFRSILDRISDGFIAIDKDWNYVYLNASAAALFNKPPASLIGKNVWQESPASVGNNFYKAYHDAMEQQQYRFLESYHDGFQRWFQSDIYPSPEGISIHFRDVTEQKQAQKQLADANERFSIVASATNDVLWETDLEAGTLWWNDNFYEKFGYDKNSVKLSDRSWEEYIHPEDKAHVLEVVEAAINDPSITTWSDEYRFRKADGTYLNIFDRCHIARNADGKAIRMIGSMADITPLFETKMELQRSLQAVIKERALADRLIDSLPGVFYFFDANGKFIRWNKQFEFVTGYSAEEIANMHPTQFFPPEEREYIARQIGGAFEMGMNDAEAPFLTNSNERIPYYFKAAMINYDGQPCLLGSGIDISKRKAAENELRESEQKYRVLFENNPMPMWMLSLPDLDIIDVNEAAENHYGYGREEFLKMNSKDLRPPEDRQRYMDAAKADNPGIRQSGVWRHHRKDGSTIMVDVIAHDMMYNNQKVRLILSNDVTQKIKADEALKESLENIRQLNDYIQNIREEERAHMAREIHDELGQQLTVLKMDVVWLNKKISQPNNEAVTEKLQSLTEMIDSTVRTVRRISTELRPSLLDDLGLIATMDWHLKEFENRFGIKTYFKEPEKDLDVSAAIKTGIFRIFQESLTNVARHAQAQNVHLAFEQQGSFLQLSIEDDGKGFEESKLKDRHTLGILGMKERTSMMGGEYKISSTPGKGTKVIVTVPIHESDQRPNTNQSL
jgi:PAS domain S-box-containing protein